MNEVKQEPELPPGFVTWLIGHQVSLACSSYQTGRLVLIGAQRSGAPAYSSPQFPGAMGLAAFSQRLYLAGRAAIWRLENTLRPNELVDGRFDRLFVPRNAQSPETSLRTSWVSSRRGGSSSSIPATAAWRRSA
jgi:hypothetical protein